MLLPQGTLRIIRTVEVDSKKLKQIADILGIKNFDIKNLDSAQIDFVYRTVGGAEQKK